MMKLFLVLVLLVTVVLPVTAQDDLATTIGYGKTEFGSISSTTPSEAWQFEGFAADLITITMNQAIGELDPYLLLLDPYGRVLAVDDNSGDVRPNARIRNLRLEINGTYTILAQASRGTFGDYEITLIRDETGMIYGQAGSGGDIPYDIPMIGGISSRNQSDHWTFEGLLGDVISVEMKKLSGTLNPYLILLDPEGTILATDDDGAGNRNALIGTKRLTMAGTYTIIAQATPRSLTAGDYELRLTRTETGVAFVSGGGAATYGTAYYGTLWNGNPSETWTFEGIPGEIVTISANRTGGNLDTYLTLIGPNGLTLATDDNGGDTSPNARIRNRQLSQSGTYSVIAQRPAGGSGAATVGGYELLIERQSEGVIHRAGGGRVSYDSPVQAALWDDNPFDEWSIDAVAGERITIEMEKKSGNFDPRLRLFGPDGTLLNSGDVRMADITIQEGGSYTIVATRGQVGTAGDYELRVLLTQVGLVERIGGGPIAFGERRISAITVANPADIWTFEGREGNRVQIEMLRTTGNLDPYLLVFRPDGALLITDDNTAGNNDARINATPLPVSGTYTVIAQASLARLTSIGNYGIVVSVIETADGSPIPPAGGGDMLLGDTANGRISNADPTDTFRIQIFTPTTLTIRLIRMEGNLNGYLEVFDAEGTLIIDDDDTAGGFNPLIENLTLEEGEYTIVVRRPDADTVSEGVYKLTVETVE